MWTASEYTILIDLLVRTSSQFVFFFVTCVAFVSEKLAMAAKPAVVTASCSKTVFTYNFNTDSCSKL